ncbi:hypothetical protein RQP46_008135 [Phenoliferia psychrophenolica]
MPPWTYDRTYDEFDCSCGRSFKSVQAVNRHCEASGAHNYCSKCQRDFNDYNALSSHLANSPYHGWCTLCDEDYDSQEKLNQHRYDEHEVCPSCSTVLRNANGLHEHARQLHPYCIPCRKIFKNDNNLNAHLNSSTHQPANVECPLRGCERKLISLSALILHWESGKCGSGFNRRQLDAYVRSNATLSRALVNPNVRLLTNSTNAPPLAPYIATNRAWDPQRQAFIFYLCDTTFQSLPGLNQHLASPRHSGPTIKTYKCPHKTCGREAVTLSALWQHIESGNCGIDRFRLYQGAMAALMSGTRALTL